MPSVQVSYNVTTMDSKGVSEVLKEHGGVIGDIVTDKVRKFQYGKVRKW
jgi:phage replication-related protein YjqB (UPF0714/DUF867 family)